MDATEKRIIQAIDENREEILAFARDIYTHAELGYKEFRTAEAFIKKVGVHSERIESELAVTGVKAYLNQDKKDNFSLALIGELDALRIPGHKYYNPQTDGAHCCGHHAQLTGVFGASIALSLPEVAKELDGQVIFFATPAEEYGEVDFKKGLMQKGKIKYGGGKCELIRIGAFDDVDVALAHHTSIGNEVTYGSGENNGFVSKVIRIKGKAAHAAGAPEQGINALYAASLGLQALNAQRETFRDEDHVRVHPIQTEGGSLVNVIPEEAVIETLVRAGNEEAILDASKKTDRAFKAGAYALGAAYEIETLPGYLPGIPQEFPEEVAEIFREAVTEYPVHPAKPGSRSNGSTDVGDVQHLLPVLTFRTGGVTGGLHRSDFEVVDEEEAYILTAKLFALSTYRILRNGAKVGKDLKNSYHPVYKNKEEYIRFMDSFYVTERGGGSEDI